jgi:hypothetical protein
MILALGGNGITTLISTHNRILSIFLNPLHKEVTELFNINSSNKLQIKELETEESIYQKHGGKGSGEITFTDCDRRDGFTVW